MTEFYKTMKAHINYKIESWVLMQKQKSNVRLADMKFLMRVKVCTRTDNMTNANIREELKMNNINNKIRTTKKTLGYLM